MQTQEMKYPIFKAFSQSLLIVTDHLLCFSKTAGAAALILLVLSFIFGQSFLCMLPDMQGKIYCGSDIAIYMLYMLIKLFIFSLFLRIWADQIFLKKNISLEYFKSNIVRFFKFFGLFLLFLCINSLPAFSLYFLIIRIPNPVWQIEILYFLFFSIGFIIPFALLRFYKNIALFIEDLPCLDIKQTYIQTNFKSSKIFLSFSLVLAFCIFFFFTINSNLKLHVFEPLGLYNMLAEYIFNFAILCVLTFMFNFVMIQKEIFEQKN